MDVTEPELKVGKRVPVCTKKPQADSGLVALIIGGGAGGLIAAETLRKEGYPGKVLIISRETYLPIDRYCFCIASYFC